MNDILAQIGAVIAVIAAAIAYGWRKRAKKEAERDAREYQKTFERAAGARTSDDDDDNTAWLHDFGKGKR